VRNILHNLIRRVPSTGNLSHSEMYVVDLTHAVARALNLQLSHDGEYDQMHTILPALATVYSKLPPCTVCVPYVHHSNVTMVMMVSLTSHTIYYTVSPRLRTMLDVLHKGQKIS